MNHRAFRLAIINFMIHKDICDYFCRNMNLSGTDSTAAMEKYLHKNHLRQNGLSHCCVFKYMQSPSSDLSIYVVVSWNVQKYIATESRHTLCNDI